MRFTTRMTVLFALVLVAFLVSSLPVTAALFREATRPAGDRTEGWNKVTLLWASLDAEAKVKAAGLMDAVVAWKAASAAPSLEGDARYLRFQTGFLLFSVFQSLVLLMVALAGVRLLTLPVRRMTKVVKRLKEGDSTARLESSGGTEWQALARQFNGMLDRNRVLNRLQGWQEVAAFLSHQIKNPLTAISLAAQNVGLLIPQLPELAAENLGIISSQSRRIDTLVRRLKDLTSFEELTPTVVDVDQWLAQWVASRRREDEMWVVNVPPVGRASLVMLLAEQALDNLVNNSREARQEGRVLNIELRAERRDDTVVLHWRDNNRLAEGTTAEMVGTARFTTKNEGSGLGVFFVRRVAELHGGSLTVSALEEGLAFTLTLEGEPHGAHSRR